jgi:hypothetical protein
MQHRVYADYTYMSVADHVVTGAQTIVNLFRDVSTLVPNAGPLQQVMSVTGQLISIVKEIRDNKEDCEHLIERILLFVKNLAKECSQLNVPILHGTPTAARLYTLTMYVILVLS